MEFFHKNLKLIVHTSVYPPSEDSIMLANAAEFAHGNVLEIGCGSGIVSLCAASNPKNTVLGVDINQDAVQCAIKNAKNNQITNVHFIESDLFSSVEGKFDTIMFNPPYLPTSHEERISGSINHAFDGGEDGRKIVDRFLDEFGNYQKPKGVLLLVQSSLNDLEKTITKLKKLGYQVDIINEEKFFFEKLYLIMATKN